jgi:hypothetical protein
VVGNDFADAVLNTGGSNDNDIDARVTCDGFSWTCNNYLVVVDKLV